MALCPLLKEECIRDRCHWWRKDDLRLVSDCSVVLAPGAVNNISKRLDLAFSEINIDGERLIEEYTENLENTGWEKNTEDK